MVVLPGGTQIERDEKKRSDRAGWDERWREGWLLSLELSAWLVCTTISLIIMYIEFQIRIDNNTKVSDKVWGGQWNIIYGKRCTMVGLPTTNT